MSELKLQSEITRKFSELFPEKRGQLFHVSNERNSQKQAFQARAVGIFPGVSDFIFIDNFKKSHNCLSNKFRFVAIEIKKPNSRHKREHIEQQLEWGRLVESLGGKWHLCTSVEQAINCIDYFCNEKDKGMSISDVEKLLENQKTKTILFEKNKVI